MDLEKICALLFCVGVFLVLSVRRFDKTLVVFLSIGIYALARNFFLESKNHLETPSDLFHFINWNTLLLIFSAMILTYFFKKTGFFSFLAIKVAKFSRGNPVILYFFLYICTAIFSAFLGAIPAIVLVVPVSILLAVELNISPQPFLISETVASTIGSLLCPWAEPLIAMVASVFSLEYVTFLQVMAPLAGSIFVMVGFVGFFLFRKNLLATNERRARIMDFDETQSLQEPVLLKKTSLVMLIVLIGLIFGPFFSISTSIVVLCGSVVLMLWAREKEIDYYFSQVEWNYLFFLLGLFILMGVWESAGLIQLIDRKIQSLFGMNELATSLLLLWGLGALSTITEGMAYTSILIPFVKNWVLLKPSSTLWVPVVMGISLGGMASISGATVNGVMVMMANKSGFKIDFWTYTRYGLLFAFLSLIVASIFLFT